MKGDQRLLAFLRLNILENLVFIVDEEISVLVLVHCDCGHAYPPIGRLPVALNALNLPSETECNQ